MAKPSLQFSLKAMLIVTSAIGIWLGYHVNLARRQREAVARLETLAEGNALWFYAHEWDEDRETRKPTGTQLEPGPSWIRNLLGIDCWDSVVAINAQGCDLTDSALAWLLDRLPSVSYLELRLNPIGDASMSKVATMRNLKTLRVSRTNISDSGLRDIGRIKSLRTLDLCGDDVTDSGLLALSDLTELRNLFVSSTKVTDEGIRKLKEVLPRVKQRRY